MAVYAIQYDNVMCGFYTMDLIAEISNHICLSS
jgi:hypothetical protein